jgi:hypothetical protein
MFGGQKPITLSLIPIGYTMEAASITKKIQMLGAGVYALKETHESGH